MLGMPSCPYLLKGLLGLSGIMRLVSFFLAINLKLWSWIPKLFGHEIHIRSISLFPFTLRGIAYKYRSSTLSLDARIGSLKLAFHVPTPCAPKLVSVTVEDASYRKADLHAFKSDKTSMVVWVLPVFFRRTSSSYVTVKMRGVVIDNVDAEEEAWWAREIRGNITETIMAGETIRLHDLKTKLWLYEPISPSTRAAKVDVNGETVGEGDDPECTAEGVEEDEAELDVLDDSAVQARGIQDEAEHEARARIYAVQWMLRNDHNQRVYSFGSLNAELRRPWGAPPYPASPDRMGVRQEVRVPQGSLVLKATDLTWTKLPRAEGDGAYFKVSTPIQLLQSIVSFPWYAARTVRDPMSVVDIETQDVEITFREFRVRDAEIFKHGLEAAKARYGGTAPRTKQVISDSGWALFCDGVERALSND